MPALKNNRWELMAQGLAQGKTEDAAYEFAGFRPNRGNACRLTAKESIQTRKAEIMLAAVTPAQKKRIHESVERIADRLAGIAEQDATEIMFVEDGKVQVPDTKTLSPEARMSIAGYKQTKDGIEVKLHDPMSALAMLSKYKGMFKENVNLTVELSLADLVNASFQQKAKDKG